MSRFHFDVTLASLRFNTELTLRALRGDTEVTLESNAEAKSGPIASYIKSEKIVGNVLGTYFEMFYNG